MEEGKTWELKTYFDEFPYNYDYVACISGDTIVDGQACKKFFRNGRLYAFLYEEEQKVYYRYFRNMNYWQLIYDFSLMPGDVVTDELGYAHEVERVDTITGATGEPFRRIIFKFVPHSMQPVWVSGIGGRQNLWDPWVYTPGDYCHLATCSVDDSLLFEGDEMMLGVVSDDRESGIVKIDGLKYRLDDERHEATLEIENRWNGELSIPSTVEYGGQNYTVTNMKAHTFSGCRTLTRVTLPSTISATDDNPFVSCNSLETIGVDAANAWLQSVGGALLSADGKRLFSYPAGAKAGSYTVPDGVEVIGLDAFSRSPHLVSVVLPSGVREMHFHAFEKCKHLEHVTLSSSVERIDNNAFGDCTSLKVLDLPESVTHLGNNAFAGCRIDSLIIRTLYSVLCPNKSVFSGIDPSSVLYVHRTELEKYQAIFPGTVLPLSDDETSLRLPSQDYVQDDCSSQTLYDLQGRRVQGRPRQGVYIRGGRKQVVR